MSRTALSGPPQYIYSYGWIDVAIKYYLLAYNVLATLGWSYVLLSLLVHLFSPSALPIQEQVSTKASNTITRYLSFIPFLKSTPLLAPSTPAQIQSRLHPFFVPYFQRASSAYSKVGEQTAWVQTLAVLEIVHALVGFVRSPIATTGMQVFSRLVLVWGIAEHFEVVSIVDRAQPFFFFCLSSVCSFV